MNDNQPNNIASLLSASWLLPTTASLPSLHAGATLAVHLTCIVRPAGTRSPNAVESSPCECWIGGYSTSSAGSVT